MQPSKPADILLFSVLGNSSCLFIADAHLAEWQSLNKRGATLLYGLTKNLQFNLENAALDRACLKNQYRNTHGVYKCVQSKWVSCVAANSERTIHGSLVLRGLLDEMSWYYQAQWGAAAGSIWECSSAQVCVHSGMTRGIGWGWRGWEGRGKCRIFFAVHLCYRLVQPASICAADCSSLLCAIFSARDVCERGRRDTIALAN